MNQDARLAADRAARKSYGKLLSILASKSRDISGAEDALADAFASALHVWPESGVPANPDAWLLVSARNALMNVQRHRKVRDDAAMEIGREYEALSADTRAFPDERLKLLFVCAHPSIDFAIRTPLMLQTVLGLDAARIGSAFLISPTTMGQRLVRAKAKIRDARLRFQIPEPEFLPDRLSDVLDAVYAAFGTGWDAISGAEADLKDLAGEAIFLGRLLVELLPHEPEAKGLLSLMLFCEARRKARRDDQANFVPLKEQDARLWDRAMIVEADRLLSEAAEKVRFGRYQCEAAIQSVHVQRPVTGRTNLDALTTLYQLLAAYSPTVGVLIAQASVWLEAGRTQAALDSLDTIRSDASQRYQPYWVTRYFCLKALGHQDDAATALDMAMGLTEDPAVRRYLGTLRR